MKKIRSIVLAALCAIAALSCSKEKGTDERTPVADAPLQTLEARTVAVKSFLDENINILWNSGDALSVFDGAENKEFTTEDEGAEARFNYYGPLSKDKSFYALYPYDEAASVAGNVISTTIPTTQAAVAGSFARGANLAVGYASYGKMVLFKNALAYAKVGFKSEAGARISKIVFRSNDETVLLSGKATLDVTVTDGEVSDIAAVVTEGVPYAEVVAPEGEFLAAGTDYYIAVAPAALTGGYSIDFVDEDGLVLTKTYDADTYKAAVLKRNNIAPTGKKNIDNIEVEAWYRVHNANLQKANHPGAGNYLVVKKMDDGSYRILDDEGSDTYVVKGANTGFELSGTRMATNTTYKKLTMESIVAFVFRNAWVSSSDATSSITKANDEVIVGGGNIGIEVASYLSGRDPVFFANITLYNRHDNTQITVTLDNLACTLASDEGYITGKFNTKASGTNPNGNPDTCPDLVDALMANAGDFSGNRESIINNAIAAIKGTDNAFTAGGWSSKEYSRAKISVELFDIYSFSYITAYPIGAGLNYSNHFMIKTEDLLSGASTSPVTLYKKESKPYSYYLTVK